MAASFQSDVVAAAVAEMQRMDQLFEQKIQSGNAHLFVDRFATQLQQRLRNATPKSMEAAVEDVASVIAVGFAESLRKSPSTLPVGAQLLLRVLTNSSIRTSALRSLLDRLADDPRVSLSGADVRQLETQLRAANSVARMPLIRQLAAQPPSLGRWQRMSVAELEAEAATAEEMRAADRVALIALLIRRGESGDLRQRLREFFAAERRLPRDELLQRARDRERVGEVFGREIAAAMAKSEWAVVDEMWEMRSGHGARQVLSYILCLCARDQTDKAHSVAVQFAKTLNSLRWRRSGEAAISRDTDPDPDVESQQTLVDERLLLLVSDTQLDGFAAAVKGIVEEEAVAEVRSRAWAAKFAALLERDALDDAFQRVLNVAARQSYIPPDEAIELIKAAVRHERNDILGKVKCLITHQQDLNAVYILLGVALLELDNPKGVLVLQKVGHVPSRMLQFFTQRQIRLGRAVALHGLFTAFNKLENSTADLNVLLEEAANLYADQSNLDGLRELYAEARRTSFAISHKLKARFETRIKELESAHPRRSQTPSSQSSSKSAASSNGSTERRSQTPNGKREPKLACQK